MRVSAGAIVWLFVAAAVDVGCRSRVKELDNAELSPTPRILAAPSGALGAYAKNRQTPINGRTELSLGPADGGVVRNQGSTDEPFSYDGGDHL